MLAKHLARLVLLLLSYLSLECLLLPADFIVSVPASEAIKPSVFILSGLDIDQFLIMLVTVEVFLNQAVFVEVVLAHITKGTFTNNHVRFIALPRLVF